MADDRATVNGHNDRADSPNGIYPSEDLDAVIIGAGYGRPYVTDLITVLMKG